MAELRTHWDNRYQEGNTPWDSQLPSQELDLVIRQNGIAPCRALELGCGSGTNAVHLAKLGFAVTAVDCSSVALEIGQGRADEAGVSIDWVCDDVRVWKTDDEFDFIFDRGCFHCVRRENTAPVAVETLRRFCHSGTRLLILTGNANEQREKGPPQLSEDEIRMELGTAFEIIQLREFYFEDPGGVQGPLGWSCLLGCW